MPIRCFVFLLVLFGFLSLKIREKEERKERKNKDAEMTRIAFLFTHFFGTFRPVMNDSLQGEAVPLAKVILDYLHGLEGESAELLRALARQVMAKKELPPLLNDHCPAYKTVGGAIREVLGQIRAQRFGAS